MGNIKATYPGATDGLSQYLAKIREHPMITAEQERKLAQRWRATRDPSAINELAGSHLRLVAKIARGFSGYGLPLSDMISEGHVGLMEAAARFDPDRGARFATYATWWVRATIQEHVLHSWSLVKIGTTATQKKLFFNLRRLKAQLQEFDSGDLAPDSVETIASTLNVPANDVIKMNYRLTGGDLSLQSKLDPNTDDDWQDQLVDDNLSHETLIADKQVLDKRRAHLRKSLATLSPRERHIVLERRLKESPTTLEVLSQEYGISRERVRQIEKRALDKLGTRVRAAARRSNAASASRRSPPAEEPAAIAA